MPNLRTMRSFAVELMKIAADIKDADIQKLLANRRGEEYLDGGRLPTDTTKETGFIWKQAASGGYTAPLGLSSTGSYDLKSKKKKSNSYQKNRDYAGTAIKGGLTGLGLLGAHNALHGRFGAPVGSSAIHKAMKASRQAATAGAGIAVADRAYRYDELPGMDKNANLELTLGAKFKSPATELHNGQQAGSFRSGAHVSAAPKSLSLGNKFKLPTR